MILCPHCKRSIGEGPVDAEAAQLVRLYKAKGVAAVNDYCLKLGLRQSDLAVLKEKFHDLVRKEMR